MSTTHTIERHVDNWRELHNQGYFADHRRYQDRLHDRGVDEFTRLLSLTSADTLLELGPTNHQTYFWYWLVADKPVSGRPPERFEDRAY